MPLLCVVGLNYSYHWLSLSLSLCACLHGGMYSSFIALGVDVTMLNQHEKLGLEGWDFHWWDWCHCNSWIRCSDWGWSGGAMYIDGAFEPGTPTYIHIAYVQIKLARCQIPPIELCPAPDSAARWRISLFCCKVFVFLHLLSFAVIQVQKSIISTQCRKVCQWLVLILSGKRSEFQTWHPTTKHWVEEHDSCSFCRTLKTMLHGFMQSLARWKRYARRQAKYVRDRAQ
jgi:hypothetical protein